MILDIIKGKTTPVEVARQHGVTVAAVERWCDDFITQGSEALRSHPRDQTAQFEAREQQLLAKVGELTLAVDILKGRTVFSARTYRTGSHDCYHQ